MDSSIPVLSLILVLLQFSVSMDTCSFCHLKSFDTKVQVDAVKQDKHLIILFFLRRGNQADLLLGSFSFGGLLLGLGARLPPGLVVLLVLLQVLVSLAVALPSLLVVVGVRRRLLVTSAGRQSTARV